MTKKLTLAQSHPAVVLLYFLSAIVFSMLTMNPFYLGLSFFVALALNLYLDGVANTMKTLLHFLPLWFLLVLINTFFSGQGLTILFSLGSRPVTLESMVYAVFSGLMLITVLLWFRAYQEVSSADHLMTIGSKRFPVTTLLLSMVLRYVPDTVRHGETVRLNQKALLGAEDPPRKQKMAFLTRMATVLMSWSMENAMDTAATMRAKGYPSEVRKPYQRARLTLADVMSLLMLTALIALQIAGYVIHAPGFLYYPYLMLPFNVPSLAWRLIALAGYAVLLLFPFWSELRAMWLEFKVNMAARSMGGAPRRGLVFLGPARPTTAYENEHESEPMIGPNHMTRRVNEVTEVVEGAMEDSGEAEADLSSRYAAELRQLSFTYPGETNPALSDLSLSFDRGSLTLLTGASGSGKTTLLRLFSPEITPVGELSGQRLIDGRPATTFSRGAKAVNIGFVRQNPDHQIVMDTVWHELAFGLENMGLDRDEIERRLAETSNYFGINTWLDRKVEALSGGEKQTLNLASNLIMQPSLLLLDEPMAQLDPIARRNFLSQLIKVREETGTTILLSEHIVDDLLPYADRVIMLERGRVAFDGTPEAYAAHLLEEERPFAISLPLPARLYHRLDKRGKVSGAGTYPLTVRDGRTLLARFTEPAVETAEPKAAVEEKEVMLEARHLWFRYDRRHPYVLRDASIAIHKGERHALVGGNGSGKSTLLYVLSGGLPALRGKVVRDKTHQVAMLSQNPMAAFSQESVWQELLEFRDFFSYGEEEAESYLRRFGMTHLSKRHPYDLSGGEMQKLALAKALLTRPDVLLLDEPVKGLDPVARHEVARILNSLREDGVTQLLVSHDLDFVSAVADRCSMLFDGRVEGTAPMTAFFAGNAYFTTTARRLTRGLLPATVTEAALDAWAEKR